MITRDEMTRDLKRLSYYANCIELFEKRQITNEYICTLNDRNRRELSYINRNLDDCINKYATLLLKYIKYIFELDDILYQSILLAKYVVGVSTGVLMRNFRNDRQYLQGELKKARAYLYKKMTQGEG